MICPGQSVTEIIEGCNKLELNCWIARVAYMQPKYVLELGTGQGVSGDLIMSALPAESKFTTINYNYPANYCFGEQLSRWLSDKRLTILNADTIDPKTVDKVVKDVDLLFIDTLHEAWQAATELRNFQKILIDGAIVIVDDLSHNDMCDFWKSLDYEKVGNKDQGIFRYNAKRSYWMTFPHGKTPKEEAGVQDA